MPRDRNRYRALPLMEPLDEVIEELVDAAAHLSVALCIRTGARDPTSE